MHPERGPTRTAPPYSRFRCLVCQEFVLGTASGHCPKCGFVPPTAPNAPASSLTPWPIGIVIAGVAIALAVILLLQR